MKKGLLFLFLMISYAVFSQERKMINEELADKLSRFPVAGIRREYPNKPGHVFKGPEDVGKSPKDLHPAFYGCFDWHSSVHGHWMLVRLLRHFPGIPLADTLKRVLDVSLNPENIAKEAAYFRAHPTFERTYGWAWLLKLDEELQKWGSPEAGKWHKALQPLTFEILRLWKAYLPIQTYPDRTGVHTNSAFALGFAIDWAKTAKDTAFYRVLKEKAFAFYGEEKHSPAYLEPNGSDFFSPSLEIAGLMGRLMDAETYAGWLEDFFDRSGIDNVSSPLIVSDITDYYTVHLVGLFFSRAWCMNLIADALPEGHPLVRHFRTTAGALTTQALPMLFEGNYGGDHWLASFAVYALTE